MLAALDDTESAAMVWMPAHTKESDVGQAYLGDGSRLTCSDRKGNNEADRLAKLAVEAHRVPKHVRDEVKELNAVVEKTARWVARATYAAGHQTVKPCRDSEASKAAAAAKTRVKAPKDSQVKVVASPPAALGGWKGAGKAKVKLRYAPRRRQRVGHHGWQAEKAREVH
jgi:hypothetical protein